MQICLNILRAGLIASRVDLSVYKYPGVIAAPLVIGTIAGSGGKFLQDGIQLACGSLHGKNHHLQLSSCYLISMQSRRHQQCSHIHCFATKWKCSSHCQANPTIPQVHLAAQHAAGNDVIIEKIIHEKTAPFGVNMMTSQVLYQAAQDVMISFFCPVFTAFICK